MPIAKYYNKYKSANPTSGVWALDKTESACDGKVCYGHALSETSGWYGDNTDFVYRNFPWFIRGNQFVYDTSAGMFSVYFFDGSEGKATSCRLVLTP